MPTMVKYVLKRLLMLIPVLLGVMLIVFVFQAISGDDPVAMLLGVGATKEQVAEVTHKMGLDQPIYVQFLKYIWNFLTRGDLGTSYATNRPVLYEIMVRLPYTAFLAVGSVLIRVLLGLPLGVLSAVKQYSWATRDTRFFRFYVVVPAVLAALHLIVFFRRST
jgi:peptide/nickel transport system permease protein